MRSLILSLLPAVLATAALAPTVGCSGDPTSIDTNSDELRALSAREVLGTVQGCGSPVFTRYTRTPKYRAFSYVARAGEKLDITVASADGDAMAWLVDASFATRAFDDDAGGSPEEDTATTTDAKISYTVQSAGTYYVVLREKSGREADFSVTVQSNVASCAPKTGPSACEGVAAGTWVSETVLSGGLVNAVKLALDPSGSPRFYARKDRGDVFVERDARGEWASSAFAPSGVDGRTQSIAGDPTGAVFLGRARTLPNLDRVYELGYRALGGAFEWTALTTRSSTYLDYAAMKVTGDGELHYVLTTRGYQTTTPSSDSLVHASRAPGGAWAETTVERADFAGRSPSLDIDASGGVHVLYESSHDVRYAYKAKSAASFATETIEHLPNGQGRSVRVDAAGVVHAAFDGRYARRAPGGTWEIASYATWPVYGGVTVALGPDARVDVVSEDGNAVRVASRAADGTWTNVTLDPSPATPNQRIAPSAVTAPDGTLHVGYVAGGNLRHARRCP